MASGDGDTSNAAVGAGWAAVLEGSMMETYDERRDRERRDDRYDDRGPGHETYDEQVERWRRGWEDEDRRGDEW